jgi:hypothetical protein
MMIVAVSAVAEDLAAIAQIVVRVVTKVAWKEIWNDYWRSSSFLPSSEILPFLWCQCAKDRLQGYASPLAVYQ